jgi:hypothetical protein
MCLIMDDACNRRSGHAEPVYGTNCSPHLGCRLPGSGVVADNRDKKSPAVGAGLKTTKRRMEERFQLTPDAALQQERMRVLLRCVN